MFLWMIECGKHSFAEALKFSMVENYALEKNSFEQEFPMKPNKWSS